MSQAVNNAATQAVESGIYAAERSKQGTNALPQDIDATKREAQVKASDIQTVASDAAEAAQEKFPETAHQAVSTTDVLQHDLADKTNAAVAEGQHDVHQAAVTGGSYLDQAKLLAGSAIATAQAYVEAGQQKITPDPNSTAGTVTSTLASAANTTLNATKYALSTAQQTLQPHVDNARAAAQPHVDGVVDKTGATLQSARDTVQPHIDNAVNTASSYAQSAKDTVQPHVDYAVETATPYVQSAKETAQPHVERAINAAQPYLQSTKEAVQPHVDATLEAVRDKDEGNAVNPSCEG